MAKVGYYVLELVCDSSRCPRAAKNPLGIYRVEVRGSGYDDAVAKAINQAGWDIQPGEYWVYCPDCARRRREALAALKADEI